MTSPAEAPERRPGEPGRPVHVLFGLRHAGYFSLFQSTLELLAARGHRVEVALESDKYLSERLLELAAQHPNLTVGVVPGRPRDHWSTFSTSLRGVLDYLRYLEPAYRDAPKLRERAAAPLPPLVARLVADGPGLRAPAGRRLLARLLRRLERSVPTSEVIEEYLRARNPDLVIVTPLFGLNSSQVHHLRAAKALGITTALCVASWDNLSNKGLIHEAPDLVTVWNEIQRREATDLHGLPIERVTATGAQNFDKWFEAGSGTTREEFCAKVGLAADRPIILYLCSSGFIAPREAEYVVSWIGRLRERGGVLAEAGILVRPHPQNTAQWSRVDLRPERQVALLPDPANTPHATGKADWAQGDFYDSMHHAAAVVGVNTSAMIESAIVGREVFTLLAPEFAETQAGTLHFDYLLAENGGILNVARSFDEHAAHLTTALASEPDGERRRRFLESFVRPHGLDRPATPILVDTLEVAALAPAPSPVVAGWATELLRAGLSVPLVTLGVVGRTLARGRRARPRRALARARRAVVVASLSAGGRLVRRSMRSDAFRTRVVPRSVRTLTRTATALRQAPRDVAGQDRFGTAPELPDETLVVEAWR